MAVYYLDSSAVVKRYVQEAGSDWVRALFIGVPVNEVVVSAITAVEVTSAIARRIRSGGTSPEGGRTALRAFHDHLLSQYQVIDVSDRILRRAVSLAESRALRGYDAVQLATALEVNGITPRNADRMTMASADRELNAAASSEGLRVEDPTAHA